MTALDSIPTELRERFNDRLRIFQVRGQAVVLDSELAAIYRKAVGRNGARFPNDFLFRLTAKELASLRFQIGTSKGRGGRPYVPWVFTEHGAILAATILNSWFPFFMATRQSSPGMELRDQVNSLERLQ